MTIAQAAAMLNVKKATIYWLIKQHKLEVVEVRTPLQVTTDSVLRYSANRASPGRPAGHR